MWKTTDGSTGRLVQLCLGYFTFYVITGISVKYFLGSGMKGLQFLPYSTLGGTSICLITVLALGWYRLDSNRMIEKGRFKFPSEFLYIIPSGICTAVVIPTTTLMYTLPITVMLAMVIMRGGVIVISRIVDEVQIRQGILTRKVYWQENVGVVLAMLVLCVRLFWNKLFGDSKEEFTLLESTAAMVILGCYLSAYAVRIYIMNYYKNTRPKGKPHDNKGFFGVEQISASMTLVLVTGALLLAPSLFEVIETSRIGIFDAAILDPVSSWQWAILAGMAFGVVAFFSVFIFMYKGRTATFAGLINRLTSLMAGTLATLIYAFGWNPDKYPKPQDWASLVIIIIAIGFLTFAERRRAAELIAEKEIEA